MKKLITILHNLSLRAAEVPFIQKIIIVSRERKILTKVTCLLLAGGLWFYVESKRINEAHFRIQMQVDISHEFAVADMEKKYLTVTAKGSTDDLRNVLPGNITVIVKIQNPKLGSATRYPVTVIGTGLPDTVSIVPEDKTVFVTVESRAVKRIPITPITEGSLDSHYIAGNIRVIPDEIEISGATTIISKINSVRTEPILLSGHSASFQQSAKLSIEDFKYCEITQKQVEALVSILESKGTSSFNIVPTLKGISENADYAIQIKNVRIVIKNDREEDISPDDFEVWCDVPPLENRINSGEEVLRVLSVSAKSKTGKTILAISPEKIIIKIRKK
jgi:YbbR domain-containing protein